MDRRTFLVGVGTTSLAVVVAACAPSSTAPSASSSASTVPTRPARGGKATLGVLRDPNELDPSSLTSGATSTYSELFYNTLWRSTLTASGFVAEPELAESWEFTDPTTLVFKLRKGVQFHDGSGFDANVAKWNFDKLIAPDSKSLVKAQLAAIYKSTQVVDQYTFRMNLVGPSGVLWFANNSNVFNVGAFMLSPAYYEKVGPTEVARTPMGTGPFRLVEWVKGDHLTARRFENYWNKDSFGVQLPYLDEVTYKPVADTTVLFNALRTGSLDWITAILPTDVKTAQSDPSLKVVIDQGSVQGMTLNVVTGPFQDRRRREAVSWAIDREAIHSGVYLGYGFVPKWLMPEGSEWIDPSVPYYTYDPAKAKAALAQAVVPGGFKFQLTIDNTTAMNQLAQVIQAQLKDVGIDVAIIPVQPGVTTQKGQKGDFDALLQDSAGLAATISPYDPSFGVGRPFSYTADTVAKALPLSQELGRTNDRARAKDLNAQIQRILFDDPGQFPGVTLHGGASIKAMRKELMGHQPSAHPAFLFVDRLWWQK